MDYRVKYERDELPEWRVEDERKRLESACEAWRELSRVASFDNEPVGTGKNGTDIISVELTKDNLNIVTTYARKRYRVSVLADVIQELEWEHVTYDAREHWVAFISENEKQVEEHDLLEVRDGNSDNKFVEAWFRIESHSEYREIRR